MQKKITTEEKRRRNREKDLLQRIGVGIDELRENGLIICDACGSDAWKIIVAGVNGSTQLKAYRCAGCGNEFTPETEH